MNLTLLVSLCELIVRHGYTTKKDARSFRKSPYHSDYDNISKIIFLNVPVRVAFSPRTTPGMSSLLEKATMKILSLLPRPHPAVKAGCFSKCAISSCHLTSAQLTRCSQLGRMVLLSILRLHNLGSQTLAQRAQIVVCRAIQLWEPSMLLKESHIRTRKTFFENMSSYFEHVSSKSYVCPHEGLTYLKLRLGHPS
jgi:hypothetical protein